jgi:cyanophycinase-like exopeptidase
MVKVHRSLLDLGGAPPRVAFLETPAGFEMGVEAIGARFQQYFRTSLDLDLLRVPYHGRDDPPARQAQALAALAEANYIVAGPGSPTYAIDQLRDTPILATILRRWQEGAQLVFASAATVALGRHALPVYEIYKVGRRPYWADGLDLLGEYGLELAIVPHWDNAEGGTHDTRACFMGMDRFGRLQALLPATAVVLGIDEHTAITLDLAAGSAAVRGKSGVAVLHGVETLRFESEGAFPIDSLRSAAPSAGPITPPISPARTRHDPLASAASRIGAGDVPAGLRLVAEDCPAELAALLHQAASAIDTRAPSDADLAPLMEVVLDLRSSLRERGEWALADGLRDRLLALGYEIRDAPEGSRWVRRG